MARDAGRRAFVTIDPPALGEMLQHAREDAPNECCGLLIGRRGVVERAVRARNLQASPTRYLIDPVDHFGAIRAARAQGRRVIGAYHSHPSSAPLPSESDIAEATGGSEFLYVIVSPAGRAPGDELRAYYLRDGNVNLVEVVSA
jgi:proteasome lid subunit RPN8/RPN11